MARNDIAGVLTALTGAAVRAANQITLMVVTLVAARVLAPEKFGIYAISATAVTLIRTLLHTGAFEYLLKAPENEDGRTECLALNIILASTLSIPLAIAVPYSYLLFRTPEVGRLIANMLPTNMISAVAAWEESQVLRQGKVRGYYFMTALAEVIAGLAAVILLLKGQGLFSLVIQIYVRNISLLLLYPFLKAPEYSKKFSMSLLWSITRWSIPRYGGTLIYFLSSYGADVFLGIFLSPAATGVYRASSRIVTAVSDMCVQPARTLAMTLFSRYASQDKSPSQVWPLVLGASNFIGWSTLAGLAAVSNRVIPIVLGGKWNNAGPVVAVLCAVRAISILDAVTGPLLVAFNCTKPVFKLQLATAVLGVAVLWVFARYGVEAAAFSMLLPAGVGAIGTIWLALGLFPDARRWLAGAIPLSVFPPAATVASALLGSAVASVLKTPQLASLLISVFAGVAGWACVAAMLRRSVFEALSAFNDSGDAPGG